MIKVPYIKTIDEPEATDQIKQIYERRRDHRSGKVSNIVKGRRRSRR